MQRLSDEKYVVYFGNEEMLVHKKYDNLKQLGYQKFDILVTAYDMTSNRKVMIQKYTDVLRNEETIKSHLNSIRIPRLFDHFTILKTYEIEGCYRNSGTSFDLYFIKEFIDTDLWTVIKSRQLLDEDHHHKYFMYLILLGLCHIHSSGIIHGDIQPKNIGLTSGSDVIIYGFDYASKNSSAHWWNNHYINEISKIFVSAPERVFGSEVYTTKFDIWSAGCILAYLIKKDVLFRYNSLINYTEDVFDILGTPSDEDIYFVNQDSWDFIKQQPHKEKKDLIDLIPQASELALDLLSKMLCINPNKRWDASKCLQHPYFRELYDDEDLKFEGVDADLSYLDMNYDESLKEFLRELRCL